MNYEVPRSIADNFGAPIQELLRLINLVNTPATDRELTIDFSNCQFANPFHLGGIAMLLCKSSLGKLPIKISFKGLDNPSVRSYFEAIHFPDCFDTQSTFSAIASLLRKYASKTYIPIVKFPANSYGLNGNIREKLLEAAGSVIEAQLQLSGSFLNAMKYLISEITNNVADHSKGDIGFMFAQYFPQKLYMDLCVIDDGLGIFESFARSDKYKPKSHVDALEMAVNGCSTKKGQEDSRGFGISTSRKMLVKGMGGRFFIWSGAAGYVEQRGSTASASVELRSNLSFPGTFVGLRVPLNPNPGFDYTEFLD